MTPDLFRGAHGIHHALDDLFCTRAVHHVGSLCLEQLRVRQHNAELIIELVKQQTELWIRDHHRSIHSGCVPALPAGVQALCPVVAACCTLGALVLPGRAFASRQSESAKMRIEPPAVRTYSTFPAEIQL